MRMLRILAKNWKNILLLLSSLPRKWILSHSPWAEILAVMLCLLMVYWAIVASCDQSEPVGMDAGWSIIGLLTGSHYSTSAVAILNTVLISSFWTMIGLHDHVALYGTFPTVTKLRLETAVNQLRRNLVDFVLCQWEEMSNEFINLHQ